MATAHQIRHLITETTTGTVRPRVSREVRGEVCRYAARRRSGSPFWPWSGSPWRGWPLARPGCDASGLTRTAGMGDAPAMTHTRSIRRSGLRLAVLVLSLALLTALGCGSEESKMERGVAVDEEVAVPDSAAEDAMTEAERRAAEDEEEDEE